MANDRASRFKVGDIVVLTHSTCGLLENMKVVVKKATKENDEKVEVETFCGPKVATLYKKVLTIKSKYLGFINPRRISNKFCDGDTAVATRHYECITEGSHVIVVSNYLGTNNKIIIQDERGNIVAISKDLLRRI